MRFSEAFDVLRDSEDDWFDPHLTVDTPLFIDPLLLFLAGEPWTSAHDRLLGHFVTCYEMVSKATSAQSTSAKIARRLLMFPEPSELRLGYTKGGTSGSGSGSVFAQRMADGIAVAISRGLERPEHIEEVGILNEGIGADRISDAAANVLKAELIEYTQQVCKRHQIPMLPHKITNARVFADAGRWLTEEVLLPSSPIDGKAIILVPQRVLNDLPTLNADDWFESHLNADLREQMNLKVGQKVSKADIVRFARLHPDRVRRWAREQVSRQDLQYDFDDDPAGVVQWDRLPVSYARAHPLSMAPPTDAEGLRVLVDQIVAQFTHFIENQRGWSLLWDSGGNEKPESAPQLVFLGMAQHYLRLFDVDIDREVELGRGPVDFKVSRGASLRALIEIKKVHNGKFWHGLETQLPSYLESDDCDHGWYVAVRYRNTRSSEIRSRDLPTLVAKTAKTVGRTLSFGLVDARPKPSASRQ